MDTLTAPAIRARKVRDGADPLVMVTAYDAPSARVVDEAGADLILVGDSVAMVVLGYDDTLQVTVDDMAHHVAAVARTEPDAHIVGDLPWMSYHVSASRTVRNAAQLIRAGAHSVKLEGGRKRLPMIERICDAEMPVMGHIGLTPQSVHALGGPRVQGRGEGAFEQLSRDARALQNAGAFAIVLELMPALIAQRLTAALAVPTIGIGAGPRCDGQVLVLHDMLGLNEGFAPRFLKRYAELGAEVQDAVSRYAEEVRKGEFPGPEHVYKV